MTEADQVRGGQRGGGRVRGPGSNSESSPNISPGPSTPSSVSRPSLGGRAELDLAVEDDEQPVARARPRGRARRPCRRWTASSRRAATPPASSSRAAKSGVWASGVGHGPDHLAGASSAAAPRGSLPLTRRARTREWCQRAGKRGQAELGVLVVAGDELAGGDAELPVEGPAIGRQLQLGDAPGRDRSAWSACRSSSVGTSRDQAPRGRGAAGRRRRPTETRAVRPSVGRASARTPRSRSTRSESRASPRAAAVPGTSAACASSTSIRAWISRRQYDTRASSRSATCGRCAAPSRLRCANSGLRSGRRPGTGRVRSGYARTTPSSSMRPRPPSGSLPRELAGVLSVMPCSALSGRCGEGRRAWAEA